MMGPTLSLSVTPKAPSDRRPVKRRLSGMNRSWSNHLEHLAENEGVS